MKKEFYNIEDPELLSKVMKGKNLKIGFIAQEIKEVFPEVVTLDTTSNLYSINYVKLIPVLAEAIKEQQDIIDKLESRIESMEETCCESALKSASISTGTDSDSYKDRAVLYQNSPNPFSVQTTIRFEIPNSVQNAQLHIFNMNGTLLKTFQINQRGHGSVIINANEFVAGMYLYTLIVENKEIETKKMILTD